jgi:hypothetical protein
LKTTIYHIYFWLAVTLLPVALSAQEIKVSQPYGSLSRDTIPDLSFQPDTTLKQAKKKKKQKRNVFYKRKTRKGYTKQGVGTKETVELFYVLKKYEEPTGYIDEIYVWDMSKAKVVKVKKEDLVKLKSYKILHGPYSKYIAGHLVESGIFYVGTKHGRWEKFKWEKKWWEKPPENKYAKVEPLQPILTGKTKYYKGFPKEAVITYYDFERTKVKEVMPFEFGEQTGDYYYFSESGQVLTKGYYELGKKVGLWIEYYEEKHRRKKETQYQKDAFEYTEPLVLKEWNDKGTLIIMNGEKVDRSKIQKVDPIKKALKRNK